MDGYTRNLWQGEDMFMMNLFDLQGTTIYPAGTMEYTGAMSIVSLRDFPINNSDRNYRTGANRTILHPYLDLETGMPRTSTHALVGMSREKGCADILMALQPVFVGSALEENSLTALQGENIHCIWYGKDTIRYTDDQLSIGKLFTDGKKFYTIELVK